MRRILPLLLLSISIPAFAEPVTLSADDWSKSRSGEALVTHPVVSRVVDAFERQPDGVIVIAHEAGESGQLWAEELQSWLVALGVSSARIKYESHVDLQGVLLLDVRSRSGL